MATYVVWYKQPEVNGKIMPCIGTGSIMKIHPNKIKKAINDIRGLEIFKARPHEAIGYKIAQGELIGDFKEITNLINI